MTDPTPDEVRTAILAAADAIASVPPLLPGPVSIPIMKADGQIRIAMHAVDEWEAALSKTNPRQSSLLELLQATPGGMGWC